MCRVLNSILAVTAVAGVAGFAESSRAPAINGAWRAVEVSMTGPGARTIRPLQPNLSIITAKHYSHIDIHADGPRPSLTDPSKASAEELRQAWGPVVAEAQHQAVRHAFRLLERFERPRRALRSRDHHAIFGVGPTAIIA